MQFACLCSIKIKRASIGFAIETSQSVRTSYTKVSGRAIKIKILAVRDEKQWQKSWKADIIPFTYRRLEYTRRNIRIRASRNRTRDFSPLLQELFRSTTTSCLTFYAQCLVLEISPTNLTCRLKFNFLNRSNSTQVLMYSGKSTSFPEILFAVVVFVLRFKTASMLRRLVYFSIKSSLLERGE